MAYLKDIDYTPEPESWTGYIAEICIMDYKKNSVFVHLHKENTVEISVFNSLVEAVGRESTDFFVIIPTEYIKKNILEYTKEELKEILLFIGIKTLEKYYSQERISKPKVSDIFDFYNHRSY